MSTSSRHSSSLPVDEMLLDLRHSLETLQESPTYSSFDYVQKQLHNIMIVAEDFIADDDY